MMRMRVMVLRLICLGIAVPVYDIAINRGLPGDRFVGFLLLGVLLVVYAEARYVLSPETTSDPAPGGTP